MEFFLHMLKCDCLFFSGPRFVRRIVLLLSGFMRLSPRYRCRAGKQTRVDLGELQ